MNSKKGTVSFALIGALIAAAIIGGIGILQQQGILGWNSTSILGQKGTLAAQITDPPNVPAGVTHVYISYTDIKVHVTGASNQSGWYPVAYSGQIDLMSVVNVRETLGSSTVPSGNYNLVTFDISSATVTYNGQNYTAYVPANRITVPIEDGGVYVRTGASIGFVIDLSPTVVPYQNGKSVGFVVVPAATSIPIPSLNWHASDDNEGAKDDLSGDSWWHTSENSLEGNLTIQNTALTSSSFSVTLKNTGDINITLNALSILSNATLVSTEASSTASQQSTTVNGYHMTNVNTQTTTTVTESHTETTDYEQEFVTIASFQVLSNGTIVQPQDGLEIPDHSVGLVILPGQSVTLTYSGQILTVHDDLNLYPITSGQVYHIAALGEFDTTAYANVTAAA